VRLREDLKNDCTELTRFLQLQLYPALLGWVIISSYKRRQGTFPEKGHVPFDAQA